MFVKFQLNHEIDMFNVVQHMNQPKDIHLISVINIVDEDALIVSVKQRLGVQALAAVTMISRVMIVMSMTR